MNSNSRINFGESHAERIAYLIAGYLRQTLTDREHDELDEWVTASDDNQRLFEELTDTKNIEKGIGEMKGTDSERMLKEIKKRISFQSSPIEKQPGRKWMYSIAASVLLMAGIAAIYLMIFRKTKPAITVVNTDGIEPGGNKATLQLSNGEIIDLEIAKNGLIDSTDGTDVLKTGDGQLTYEGSSKENPGEHVLTTPAGGQYNVTLPDGSRVWLNAKSSLKYPVVFDEKERVVELEGEGYFEIRPHPKPLSEGEGLTKTPFIVKLRNGAEVRVTGTHFNINAYDDEKVLQTTLLEGSVIVGSQESGVRSQELKAGEQGIKEGSGPSTSSGWRVVSGIDTSEIVAWKNGKFRFKDALIETIMRQVARWYNAEIIYESKPDFHFNATTIYRSEPLSKLLEVLEETGRVHFRIEGKRVFVSR